MSGLRAVPRFVAIGGGLTIEAGGRSSARSASRARRVARRTKRAPRRDQGDRRLARVLDEPARFHRGARRRRGGGLPIASRAAIKGDASLYDIRASAM
jgi:hypothetical protein